MSEVISKIKEISSIPPCNYEGYLWYSDEERPEYIGKNRSFKKADLTSYPFVVEGALYSETDGISITIRYLDGKYYIHKIDLNIIENNKKSYQEIEHKWLVAKNLERKVLMSEIWQLEKDELCANMPSYRPVFWVFKGFVPPK